MKFLKWCKKPSKYTDLDKVVHHLNSQVKKNKKFKGGDFVKWNNPLYKDSMFLGVIISDWRCIGFEMQYELMIFDFNYPLDQSSWKTRPIMESELTLLPIPNLYSTLHNYYLINKGEMK